MSIFRNWLTADGKPRGGGTNLNNLSSFWRVKKKYHCWGKNLGGWDLRLNIPHNDRHHRGGISLCGRGAIRKLKKNSEGWYSNMPKLKYRGRSRPITDSPSCFSRHRIGEWGGGKLQFPQRALLSSLSIHRRKIPPPDQPGISRRRLSIELGD